MPRPQRLGALSSVSFTLLVGALLAATVGIASTFLAPSHVSSSLASPGLQKVTSKAEANAMLNRQAGCFVPNLGQWKHPARFVHRSGPMTLYLEDRGWILDLMQRPVHHMARPLGPGPTASPKATPADGEVRQKIRGVALRMTFEGDTRMPRIVGKHKLPGHHNYFLGNDQSRWRTGVPLYGSVCYENLYPGIDLRLRETDGMSEYDLLLRPGADLSLVNVHVEGAKRLAIEGDGSLVIETTLGPVIQTVPKTWQVHGDGRKREVACSFTLLGAHRFGFAVPGWGGDTSLTIDPSLIWSTFLGGSGSEEAHALSVDASGVVTVAGWVYSTNFFPTTSGAYDTTVNGNNAFVTRLDPRKTGSAQLVYSTFLGGSSGEIVYGISVDASGVVTAAGWTWSADFPTTNGAYDATYNGGSYDAFVSRLDPRKTGSAQLVYSTFLGGSTVDQASELFVDGSGVVTVAGYTGSGSFPTTTGAYDTTWNGGQDAFVTRLDPRKTGSAQLVYSTFLGGGGDEWTSGLSVEASGVVTVAGFTVSSDFPTTSAAYDRNVNHRGAFVSRLIPAPVGKVGLIYSTFLGESSVASALSVDAKGVVTVVGSTWSSNFPTTNGAYDTTYNSPASSGLSDGFVSRLDTGKTGTAQLIYSTFLGGSGSDDLFALSVDDNGVVTAAGWTDSADFPTTSGAYDTTYTKGEFEAFVGRLDPRKTGSTQLVYSTFLGGPRLDHASALCVDGSGVVTVAGWTRSPGFPTTSGAYDTTHNALNGLADAFVSRLDMGVALYGDVHEVSLSAGGTQRLTVNAGKPHANKSYWVFGSMTGTSPGVILGSSIGSVNVPLNPDIWTDYTIAKPNTATLSATKGMLDASGTAQASFNIPNLNLPSAIGLVFYHAYLVYDANNNFYLASNPVPLKLVK